MRRSLTAIPLLGATALLLAGCVTVPVPVDRDTTDSSDPDVATPPTSEAIDCNGNEMLINEPGTEVELRGDCPSVRIEGADIEVDGDTIGTLTLRGDRIDVEFDDVDDISIEGHDNSVEVNRGGDVTIRGDRNEVDADSLGVVSISGFDNEIDADDIVSVEDNGERNTIEN